MNMESLLVKKYNMQAAKTICAKYDLDHILRHLAKWLLDKENKHKIGIGALVYRIENFPKPDSKEIREKVKVILTEVTLDNLSN